MNWYLAALKKYAVFGGRARRTEYWSFTLGNILIIFALNIIGGMLGIGGSALGSVGGDGGAAIGALLGILMGFLPAMLFALVVLLPGIAVSVRRLHDTGRSGVWLLLGLVPVVGLVLIVFMLQDSQPGANQWGENPKQAVVPAMA